MNCHECKHRRKAPGSAHSNCNHPANGIALTDPTLSMFAIFASVGRTEPMQAETGLNVKLDPHGVRKGWANHPWNFDPVWVESCDGFTERTD